ncbi:O-antigen ligase-like membrane protein [Labedella gwakjiensis]|nr:O-antigen ligase-like membrane protein [Labedella gwakjiensis]
MAGVSLAATMNVEFSLRGLVGLVAAPLTVVAVTASLSHTPDHEVPRARKFILGAIASVVLVNIVVGLRQAIFGLSAEEIRSATEGLSTYSVGDQIRLMGTFQSNQDMGLFLACMAPALLVAGLRASGRAKAGFFVVATLLYVVNFLSLTRTSLIAGVTVGLLALAIWSRGEFVLRVLRNLLVVLAGTAIFVSVLIALGVPRVQAAVDRALTLTNLDADGSFNSRRDATLPIAWNAFTSHPLGAGAGAAGPVSQQFAEVAPLGYLNADNGYLMIGLQMGFLGLAILIWMLLAVVVSLGRRGTALRTAGAAAALALAVAMLTAGYWSLLAPICIVAAVVGVAMSEPREPRSERGGLVSVDRSRTHSRQAIDA